MRFLKILFFETWDAVRDRLDWLGKLVWNIVYPPSIRTEDLDRLSRAERSSADLRIGIAMIILALAAFPLPFVVGATLFRQLEPTSPWFLGYMGWLAFIATVHICTNAKAYGIWLLRILGHVVYPPSIAEALEKDGGRGCSPHRRRECWVCAFEVVISGMAILALNIGAVAAIYRYGIGSWQARPFLAWYGILAIGLLWHFRKLVVDVIAWLLVRVCRIVYPPLMVGKVRDAREACECHGKEGCGVCCLAAFTDITGTIAVFLTGCAILTTNGMGVQAVPFIIWAAAALVLPVAVRMYRWADDVAERQAMLEAGPVLVVDASTPPAAAPLDVEAAEPLPVLPLFQEPFVQELHDAITGTPIEEATPERRKVLQDRVTAYEAEQNSGRPVPELREALTTLEQMASAAQVRQ